VFESERSALDLDNGVNGADCNTGRLIMMAYTVNACAFIDYIQVISGCNGANGAFGLASSAVCAFVGNSMCHDVSFGYLWFRCPGEIPFVAM